MRLPPSHPSIIFESKKRVNASLRFFQIRFTAFFSGQLVFIFSFKNHFHSGFHDLVADKGQAAGGCGGAGRPAVDGFQNGRNIIR